jgi:hypothetical protein
LGTHGKLIPLILIESRKLAACTREKIMEKVEAVFDAGSVQVFAVIIKILASFAIELPNGPILRKRV